MLDVHSISFFGIKNNHISIFGRWFIIFQYSSDHLFCCIERLFVSTFIQMLRVFLEAGEFLRKTG